MPYPSSLADVIGDEPDLDGTGRPPLDRSGTRVASGGR
jgi:hypothetical protein